MGDNLKTIINHIEKLHGRKGLILAMDLLKKTLDNLDKYRKEEKENGNKEK